VLGIADYEGAERVFEEHYPGDVLTSVAQERLRYAIEQNRPRGG
jgi:hypothetical protein